MSFLELNGVEKHFGNLQARSRASTSSIEKGEFVVFVGPSGCGKSTLLRMIAGLTEIDGGTPLPRRPRHHPAGVEQARPRDGVPELRALPAHERCRQHVVRAAPGQRRQGDDPARRCARAAAILNLTQYLQRTPKELSGGQRQRVAIGRAIVRAPKVFLFDEPLSNLDAALRGQTRVEIAKLHRELGATTIYVTHDQVEAMTLADRVVVLRDGAIEQVGSPLELYDHPANQFVAQFIGTPQMNIVDTAALPALRDACGVDRADRRLHRRAAGERARAAGRARPPRRPGRAGRVARRRHADLRQRRLPSANERPVQLVARQSERTELQPGDAVGLDIVPASFHLFDRQGQLVSGA